MPKKSKSERIDPSAAAAAIGRLGGLANSPKQQRARKQNAKRAGRPRRICVHCGEPVKGGHVESERDTSCGAHGWRWQTRSEHFAAKAKGKK